MIVEFTIQQPTLLHTLRGVPSTRVSWEQTGTTEDGRRLLSFWAESDDFGGFEAAMADDPTVTAPRALTALGDRRLYQVEHTTVGAEYSLYPTLIEVGGIVRRCVGTHEGWSCQVTFLDNGALSEFYDWCSDHDIEFDLHRKYDLHDENEQASSYGLTAKQRETLAYAVEAGYFQVPRGSNLDAIAADIGISHQAVSERIRRAIDLLVRHTVLLDGPPAAKAE